ncbi:Nramp family divalent metal transporter [Geobacter sp. AOG2]|uniref:Nramp family divalent metal transporter n=1 Tax=Geobacter sp. AOG2 TaxID=1566347 RepID=UPI001CC7CF8C|nr:Nramp family divalent metal transporter [Geobacter sp. AOG2]GFE59517.1 divalent metal cation transporter MntH [Geobacter sp. AOG2]
MQTKPDRGETVPIMGEETPPPVRESNDSRTVQTALDILDGQSRPNRLTRLMPFLGPAFIASVAYVDPGNFATNIQGGAQFGYLLVWVIVASNLMAMLIQTLSAKLGIATGMNLAEQCRAHFPRPVVFVMWVLMEFVAMATDLAEFLGAALGFQLLLGVPLFAGALLTALATVLILGLERYGFRPLEAVISAMVGMIALCYLLETIIVKPDWGLVAYHAIVPQFSGAESVLLASGILGATVMPHAIFLHSALTQGRIVVRDKKRLQSLYRFEIADVVIAMGMASFVNAAMLIMAAATFHYSGHAAVGTIEEAYRTLEPLLGSSAKWIFGLSLLLAGLSSSTVGTSAGQVIMQGFMQRHIPIWLRRLVTMAPSLAVIGMGLDPTRTLIVSQVVLSFGLPFAIIPLVMFTRRADIMGELVNKRITTVLAGMIAGVILALNAYLLYKTLITG